MKNKKIVDKCVQCAGDEMLEVRKAASQLHEIMGVLFDAYAPLKHKPGTDVIDYVRRLIEAEADQQRLVRAWRDESERKHKQIQELIAAVRFLEDACKNGDSGVSISGKAVTIGVSQLMRTIIKNLQFLDSSYSGHVDGKQPNNERSFLADLWVK